MKYSPVPASRAYTIFIGTLLAGLVVYGIVTGNPYGYVIAGVLFVFIGLPALVIIVLGRSQWHRRNPLHNGHDAALDATMPVDMADRGGTAGEGDERR
ncbi:MAG TPA: hypothetical protein VKQ30_09285 [Ktedonobacterales bacterium]|nr:hypothetical protein [Ktedonobacterales bacterium]